MKSLLKALRVVSGYDTMMIGLSVEDKRVDYLQKDLIKKFEHLKASAPPELHISLLYISKNTDKETSLDILTSIPLYHPTFSAQELVFLPGVHAPFDFVALRLKPSASILDFRREVEKEVDTAKMPGGFKSHLSLFRLEKGHEKEVQEIIKSYKFSPFTVKMTGAALWGPDAQIEKQVAL